MLMKSLIVEGLDTLLLSEVKIGSLHLEEPSDANKFHLVTFWTLILHRGFYP